MKKFTRILLLLLFITSAQFSFGQLNYQVGGFSTMGSTYNDLGTTGSAITMNNNDSGHSASIVFPSAFSFTYNFHTYTSFVMYVDGFLKLGDGAGDTVVNAPSLLYTSFTNTLGTLTGGPFNNSTTTAIGSSAVQDSSLIVPFGEDLYAGGNTPDFRYALTGVYGTRVLTVQWKNIKDKLQCGAPTQYDTINFQVKLYEGTNAIEFVYGRWVASTNTSTSHFAACGIKGNNCTNVQLITVTKGSTVAWSSPTGNAGNYTVNALNFGNNVVTARPAPDPGRVYHFNPVVYNDISVNTIYAQGKIALPFYTSDSIRVNISNPGINTMTSVPVTLSITGANTYTTTVTVPSIVGTGGTGPVVNMNVSFPPYTPINYGKNIIRVYTPTDDNILNDTANYGLSVSSRNFAWTDSTVGIATSSGYLAPMAFLNPFYVNSNTGLVSQVKAFIASNSQATGDTIFGMITDMTGVILGRSANYIILSSDLGNYVTLNITNPPALKNSYFLAGIACGSTVNPSLASPLNFYYLASQQNENPSRPTTSSTFPYLNYVITGPANLANANVGTSFGAPYTQYPNYRLMMECFVDPDTADVGISASIPANNGMVPTGSPISLRAYVKNFGSNVRASGLK